MIFSDTNFSIKMIRKLYKMFLLSLLIFLSACEKETPIPPSSIETKQISLEQDKAQSKLETIKLYLGAAELNAEIADENHERKAGMMYRTKMNTDEAMLFVFPYPHQTGFWMKNTTIPLSIAYIDQSSRIIEIHNLESNNTNTVDSRSGKICLLYTSPSPRDRG